LGPLTYPWMAERAETFVTMGKDSARPSPDGNGARFLDQ
jgi:hypothetical protein